MPIRKGNENGEESEDVRELREMKDGAAARLIVCLVGRR